jgi:hypothetical protein
MHSKSVAWGVRSAVKALKLDKRLALLFQGYMYEEETIGQRPD